MLTTQLFCKFAVNLGVLYTVYSIVFFVEELIYVR